jgi:hypothetical protein
MNEHHADKSMSGCVERDSHDDTVWRVYFQGRLTAPRFSNRSDAMGYLAAMRSGRTAPEHATAKAGKEVL